MVGFCTNGNICGGMAKKSGIAFEVEAIGVGIAGVGDLILLDCEKIGKFGICVLSVIPRI